MNDFQVGLSFNDDIPDDYFSDFIAEVNSAGAELRVDSRKPIPYAAFEWVIPTAVVIYLGKPFVDVLLKRAADDFGDFVYPKFKLAVQNLARLIYFGRPLPIVVITSDGRKVSAAGSLVFSIYAAADDNKKFKFVFSGDLSEDECLASIETLLKQLTEFHDPSIVDGLTKQISRLEDQRSNTIYLIYDPALQEWSAVDLMAKFRDIHIGRPGDSA